MSFFYFIIIIIVSMSNKNETKFRFFFLSINYIRMMIFGVLDFIFVSNDETISLHLYEFDNQYHIYYLYDIE